MGCEAEQQSASTGRIELRVVNLRFGGDGGGAVEESKSVGENGVMGESREGRGR